MDPFQIESKLVSIKKSTYARPNIIPSLNALHAISGCDAVPQMFGIGKKNLNAAENVSLNYLGDKDADMQDVIKGKKKVYCKMLWFI